MDGKAERRWLGTSSCDNKRTIALRANALRAYEETSPELIPPGPRSRVGTIQCDWVSSAYCPNVTCHCANIVGVGHQLRAMDDATAAGGARAQGASGVNPARWGSQRGGGRPGGPLKPHIKVTIRGDRPPRLGRDVVGIQRSQPQRRIEGGSAPRSGPFHAAHNILRRTIVALGEKHPRDSRVDWTPGRGTHRDSRFPQQFSSPVMCTIGEPRGFARTALVPG